MSAPAPTSSMPRRRLLTTVAALTATGLFLAGCQTAPPPPPAAPVDLKATREAEFKRLGFVQTAEGWEYAFTGKILFDTASDALDSDSQANAERIGKALRKLDVTQLRIEGHTDNVGAAAFNKALSLRRAETVAQALAQQGLPKSDMVTKGWGAERPIADNSTTDGRLQNRRVAVIVPAQ